ncbi:MAG: tRNA uridine-5-carboxymethylaminomethyl(34) synthesis enzyme MnmG [Rickettsiales bacterium]|nr:tRNA uridine-5-carboxymethylaminomethyl(34) synthesis enzyme MnmG [Rickettsiales bacterium]
MFEKFDVIVIGGGHAGVEAACAAARVGSEVLLITKSPQNLGEMSCNPAIGGVAKGTIVKEIDALDGIMAKAIDEAGIHFRILNASKGAAVHSPRAQADRKLYKKAINKILQNYPNLKIIFGAVEDIAVVDGKVEALILADGKKFFCKNIILTTGTFLRGMIHIGDQKTPAGRVGEAPSHGISKTLEQHNFILGRLKTGTPPRILKSSIDFSKLEEQPGDNPPQPFSYLNDEIKVAQISCFITYTNIKTHQIIKNNLDKSAMYGGYISGVGPRYCPSIEDKVHRFFDKDRHQIFLEPEGLESDLIYPNGISTSLPLNVQIEFLHTIPGLENCQVTQAGYAIEYDFVDPRQLLPTLETKKIRGLFFAGQINGTTGYEEAAGQGIVAGINAALRSKNSQEEFILDRSESYIGVMIDDLTTFGTSEPYRMLTSRAEYRLSLRADNADLRLTEKGIKFGCVGFERAEIFKNKKEKILQATEFLQELKISPNKLSNFGVTIKQDGVVRNALQLLSFPEINFDVLEKIWPQIAKENSRIGARLKNQIAINAIYSSYLQRQEQDLQIFRKEENMKIPLDLDYNNIQSLSSEVKEKLGKWRPATIGAASKIQGITPAAIMAVMIYVKNNSVKNFRENK